VEAAPGLQRCGFDLLCRNLLSSRSNIRTLASHEVAGMAAPIQCPERTLEKRNVSTVLSGREKMPEFPATLWLANFRGRFATKECFLQSSSDSDFIRVSTNRRYRLLPSSDCEAA